MDVTEILARLDGVRQTGAGTYLAKCPAHDDRSPSMSIRQTEDGRILLHDFGGCEPDAIMGALGLTLADLFPAPIYHRARPLAKPRMPGVSAADILRSLSRDLGAAAIVASDLIEGKPISAADVDRLIVATARIADAGEWVRS